MPTVDLCSHKKTHTGWSQVFPRTLDFQDANKTAECWCRELMYIDFSSVDQLHKECTQGSES